MLSKLLADVANLAAQLLILAPIHHSAVLAARACLWVANRTADLADWLDGVEDEPNV